MSEDAIAHRKHATRSRLSALALTAASVWLILLGHGCNSNSNGDNTANIGPTLIAQTKMDGNCFPKFAIALPVFSPADSVPRVDAAAHPHLTVTMMETDQQVLPPGNYAQCGTMRANI